jgi:hypothetical protein
MRHTVVSMLMDLLLVRVVGAAGFEPATPRL